MVRIGHRPEALESAGELEILERLSRDLRAAAATLTPSEARYLVDTYYQMQEQRIRGDGQARSTTIHPVEGEMGPTTEPHSLMLWSSGLFHTAENDMRRALQAYAESLPIGKWAMSIPGIGPVLSAGLMAHIDIHEAPTVGHIWSFAGLNPEKRWEKGQTRPWNARLKVVTWKIGESFVKVKNRDNDVYGHIYDARKALETERNLRGEYADQAARILTEKNWTNDTDAAVWYSGRLSLENARAILDGDSSQRMGAAKRLAGEPGSGVQMLPPGHIHARAKRYAVKLFLSHWHHVAYESTFDTPPPFPYVLTHMGHVDYFGPPHWENGKLVE